MADIIFTPETVIAWVDVETTSLDYDSLHVLEVGLIITQGLHLEELYKESFLTIPPGHTQESIVEELDDFITTMHTKSGLIDDYLQADISSTISDNANIYHYSVLDEHLRQIIKDTCGDEKVVMAGNSITFDRTVLSMHFPLFLDSIHYHSMDMTSVSMFVSTLTPHRPQFSTQATHRSLDDLERAQEQFIEWRKSAIQHLTGKKDEKTLDAVNHSVTRYR